MNNMKTYEVHPATQAGSNIVSPDVFEALSSWAVPKTVFAKSSGRSSWPRSSEKLPEASTTEDRAAWKEAQPLPRPSTAWPMIACTAASGAEGNKQAATSAGSVATGKATLDEAMTSTKAS